MKRSIRTLLALCLALSLLLAAVPAAHAAAQITKAQAKTIALNHAGYTAAQATFIKVKLDREDGIQVYEVEFFVRDNAILEYDYEINAQTGAILDWDREVEGNYTVSNIGLAAAKKAALQDAGYTASQVKFFKAKLDRDDGCYDIEFYVRGNVIVEHDYEVDAKTGKILSHDTDIEGYYPSQSTGEKIGKAKAKTIALNHAGLAASKVTFKKAKLDKEDGRWVYEVEFRLRNNRRIEYDYEIDAYTGKILSWDRDYDD
ncbi:MAG TPA: PepSY domain-containing protein [Candidatus Excrementavichristensenella intestinipullorum]|nr:PepSY domain-containing protein [Candidatus Excrementavichristensenella intestinipullorum]